MNALRLQDGYRQQQEWFIRNLFTVKSATGTAQCKWSNRLYRNSDTNIYI